MFLVSNPEDITVNGQTYQAFPITFAEEERDVEKILSHAGRELNLVNDILEYQKVIMGAETLSEDRARVSFDQSYRSETYRDQVHKILELIRENGGWKILSERQAG